MRSSLHDRAVASIRHSFQVLSQSKDLSPANDDITRCLTELVRTLTQCHAPRLTEFLLTAPELAAERAGLPDLCGQAECEMEKYWARRLLAGPPGDVQAFWYYAEYQELCRAEMALFSTRNFTNISFLGSGALPLTAFMFAEHNPQAKVVCVDSDPEAVALSRELAAHVGLSDRVDIRLMDALDYVPAAGELVVCASLLDCKPQIYKRLDDFDCALIVRDAEGPYQYLYKPAERPSQQFVECAKTEIDSRRINTSRYYERKVPHAAP